MSFALTVGGLYRLSNAWALDFETILFQVETGGVIEGDPIPVGGTTILRASWINVNTVFDGSVVVASSWSLRVEVYDINTLLFTTVLTVPDPWLDPALGLDSETLHYSDIDQFRFTLVFQTSTETGVDTYANDGFVRVYVDDVIVGFVSGLHFARGGPGASTADYITTAFGNVLTLDRVWAKSGSAIPTTDSNGVVIGSANLLYYDDFPGGDLSAWSPFLGTFPNVVSDIGGANSYGLSFSEASVTSTIANSGPFTVGGIIRRVSVPEVTPAPDEPANTSGCPVAILP